MAYRVTLESGAFNGMRDSQESLESLAAMMNCLIELNSIHLRYHPDTPLLYQAGIRYEEEPLGAEFWRDIPTVMRYRAADCEDLSGWLIAEKRVRFGIPAVPIIIPQLRPPTPQRPEGSYTYHIAVATPDVPGGVDDPSKRLGMK